MRSTARNLFSKFSSGRRGRFRQKNVKIGPILAIFELSEDLLLGTNEILLFRTEEILLSRTKETLLLRTEEILVSRTEEILLSRTKEILLSRTCLLYTSPSPRDRQKSRMPSSA